MSKQELLNVSMFILMCILMMIGLALLLCELDQFSMTKFLIIKGIGFSMIASGYFIYNKKFKHL